MNGVLGHLCAHIGLTGQEQKYNRLNFLLGSYVPIRLLSAKC